VEKEFIMNTSVRFRSAGLLATCLGTAAVAADLTVTFTRPADFVDAAYARSYATERDRAPVQHDIEQHLRKLASQFLRDGESLDVEVLDIDLAGGFEPFATRSATELRILRDVTWPRIKLRYTLTRDGAVVASAEERVSDQNYLMSSNRYPGSDRLRYEKTMLDDWFAKRFGTR
jgi:hypothetical protein